MSYNTQLAKPVFDWQPLYPLPPQPPAYRPPIMDQLNDSAVIEPYTGYLSMWHAPEIDIFDDPAPSYIGVSAPSASSSERGSPRSDHGRPFLFPSRRVLPQLLGHDDIEQNFLAMPRIPRTDVSAVKPYLVRPHYERPFKCPIQTCSSHTRGFIHKNDQIRHSLTHREDTMAYGCYPGSGLAAEKSFNRADDFKRHLIAVHGVEQTSLSGMKRVPVNLNLNNSKKLTGYAPDACGKCSTWSADFQNAKDIYDCLDDCVLCIVPGENPVRPTQRNKPPVVIQTREAVQNQYRSVKRLPRPIEEEPMRTTLTQFNLQLGGHAYGRPTGHSRQIEGFKQLLCLKPFGGTAKKIDYKPHRDNVESRAPWFSLYRMILSLRLMLVDTAISAIRSTRGLHTFLLPGNTAMPMAMLC